MPSTLSTLWSKVPSFVKWLVLVAIVGALAFAGGRFSGPAKVIDHTVTETVVKVVEVEKKVEVVQWKDREVIKYVNQATLAMDKDTDCDEKFDRVTGKLIERHCRVTDHENSSNSASGSTNTTNTGGSTSTTDHSTTTTGTTHTDTTHTVINDTKPNWHLGVGALLEPSLNLNLAIAKASITVERRLFWTVYVGVEAIPQAKLYGLHISAGF
jgi:hypothetical protein